MDCTSRYIIAELKNFGFNGTIQDFEKIIQEYLSLKKEEHIRVSKKFCFLRKEDKNKLRNDFIGIKVLFDIEQIFKESEDKYVSINKKINFSNYDFYLFFMKSLKNYRIIEVEFISNLVEKSEKDHISSL